MYMYMYIYVVVSATAIIAYMLLSDIIRMQLKHDDILIGEIEDYNFCF